MEGRAVSLRYNDGEYNEAAGTREAFGRFSDDLVAAGLPPVTVVSGDRAARVQVAIFVDRFRQQASGNGPYGDVRWWDGSAWGYPGGTRWVRWSSAGTVAVPGTGNHEKKRSNDLGWPYNAVTTAHLRAREIAARHNITCDGLGFGEAWHWTYWGALGVIGAPASTGNATPIPSEEDDMYDDDAKQKAAERHTELMTALEKVHRAAAPFKVLSWGTGLVVYNPLNGKLWILPEGYSDLLAAIGLVGGNPFRASSEQLGFATGFLPSAIGEHDVDADGFTAADLDEIKKAIAQSQVAVTSEQLQKLTDAVGAAARAGGEEGAVQALKDLTFVVSAS